MSKGKGRKNTKKDEASPNESRGIPSWQYLKNLGLSTVMVRLVPQPQHTYQRLFDNMEYDVIDALYDDQAALEAQDASEHLKAMKAVKPKNGVNRGPCLMRYDVSTSLMMQLVKYLGYEASLQILSSRMWRDPEAIEVGTTKIGEDASARLATLKDLMAQALDSQEFERVILFNYRVSPMNQNYNSGDAILKQVQDLAQGQKAAVVIVAAAEKKEDIPQTGYVLDLFDVGKSAVGVRQDRRVTACFWSLVAQHLQLRNTEGSSEPQKSDTPGKEKQKKRPKREAETGLDDKRVVLGLIGGRSGSVDIASFMGVKTISWDYPIFARDFYSEEFKGQPVQIARLLNQRLFTFFAYLNLDDEFGWQAQAHGESLSEDEERIRSKVKGKGKRKPTDQPEDPDANVSNPLTLLQPESTTANRSNPLAVMTGGEPMSPEAVSQLVFRDVHR